MYLDGFVIPIPTANIDAYRTMAIGGGEAWMKHGALAYRETLLDPADTPHDFGTSFPKLAGCREGETVVFAYILYRDRAHRDEVNAKVMAEMPEPPEMPFDMARMAYAGFIPLVEHGNS